MKPLIDPINTDDGQFHGRDNQTGALATIVTPVWTNDMQDATRSVQREMITLLTAAGIKPAEATDNQLLAALRTLFLAEDDTRVSHALQKEENLSDVESATSALANLGGLPLSGGRMTGTLNLDGVKQGEYLQTGLSAGAEGAKNYLRKMRGGSSDTIWHETVQGGGWRLATGATDNQDEITVSTTEGLRARLGVTAGYSGAFSWDQQYATRAPFFNTYATAGTSEYHPVIKQMATITGKNSYSFSMGTLVTGTALQWHLYMRGSAGQDVNYTWDTGGNFTAPGELIPGRWDNFDARYERRAACPFPVGAVLTMGNDTNPANIYPGTTWKDLASAYNGRVMQIGTAALATGGSNSVTLQAANLPSHSHKGGMNAPGGQWSTMITGTDNDGSYKMGYTSGTFTDEAHGKSVTNTPFSVANAFVQLRAWMRTA